jgi:hypothetical protein
VCQGEEGGRVLREFGKDRMQLAAGVPPQWRVEFMESSDEQPRVELSATSDGLEGVEDNEARAWYFVAPAELLGDWRDAYGGTLAIQLMHRNFLRGGSPPDFMRDAADIIIRSLTHELSYSHAVQVGR